MHTHPADVFTEVAPLWRDRPLEGDRMARRVVRHLRRGGHVLDVGCGTGAMLASLRRQAAAQGKDTGRTIGVDIAEGMAVRAGRRRGVRAMCGDAHRLPFVDQYFDVVVVADALQYVEDQARVLRELFRVTVPGGTIVLELSSRTRVHGLSRAELTSLPRWSLLRRYMQMPRSYATAAIRRTLAELGCEIEERRTTPRCHEDGHFLARLGRLSASENDLAAARRLARLDGRAVTSSSPLVIVARVPGPRTGGMPIVVRDLPTWSAERVRRALRGLPVARGYEVLVKPLRWRTRPHVQAFCDFDDRQIILQIPVPFWPFCEDVPYRARRIRQGRRWRFRWYWRRVRFERPDELVRYLYLHEYYHWYLREVRGKRSGAETACDRFALQRMGSRFIVR